MLQDTLTGSQEVAIVISLVSCASTSCSTIPADQLLGATLYSGPYNPQFSTGAQGLPPHQNFSVVVPASMPKGSARLAVTHLSLVGVSVPPLLSSSNYAHDFSAQAGPFALMEVKNITLNLA